MYIIYRKNPEGATHMVTNGISMEDNTMLEEVINYILTGKTPNDTETKEKLKPGVNGVPTPQEKLKQLQERLESGTITAEEAEAEAERYINSVEFEPVGEPVNYVHNDVISSSPNPEVSDIVSEIIERSRKEMEDMKAKLSPEIYEKEIEALTKERDSIHKMYIEMKTYRDNLMRQRDELSEKVEEADKRAEYWENRFSNLVSSIENGLKLGL
jgi:uncharacterized coiled-coil DUF342 family protein